MKEQLSTVLVVLTICSIIGAFLLFVLGRVLTDKKDKMTLTFEIESIKKDISELKADYLKIEHIQRKLDLVEEQIKHL